MTKHFIYMYILYKCMLKEKKIIFLPLFSVFSLLLANKYTVGSLGRDLFENSFMQWNKLLQRIFVHSRIGSILRTSQKFTLTRLVKENWNSLGRKMNIEKGTKKIVATLDFYLKFQLTVKMFTVCFGRPNF